MNSLVVSRERDNISRNLAASVSARLKQHADANKQDFNLTLTHYGLERLLYRLSVSKHASSFLLKGALLFTLWYDVAHRPTRDADLLALARMTWKLQSSLKCLHQNYRNLAGS